MLEIERVRESPEGVVPAETTVFLRASEVNGTPAIVERDVNGGVRTRAVSSLRPYKRAIARLIAQRRRRALDALAAYDRGDQVDVTAARSGHVRV